MVTVYILRSETTGRLYIGQTANMERRLREHDSGQTRSTRGRGPWLLVGSRTFPSRAEAVGHERRLKQLKGPARVLAALQER